jgi:mannose-6-phosphate isomerase-like protein (cupin superfamily)
MEGWGSAPAGSAWCGRETETDPAQESGAERRAEMLEMKILDKPDERRDFPRGHLEAVHLTGLDFAVGTFEPGWRWSESVAPIAGTKSCEVHHNGYVVQGRLHVRMDDGDEGELGPGDVFVVSPGHDAWVVGDEQCVVYDFAGGMAQEYAKSSGS